MLKMGFVAAVVGLVAGAVCEGAVSYSAAGNVLPAGPEFVRFDANHFVSVLPGNPYTGTGFNAAQSVAGGVYSTGPTSQGQYTFWYSPVQVLDHTKVVEVSARLRLIGEASANVTDRAGLALGLTDDRGLYQEMYINSGEVFINKVGRVRDVAYGLDATQWHDYVLRLAGDVITVEVDGVTRLAGSVFAASGAPMLPSWAVVGDITSQASSTWEMQSFSVAVVPEVGVVGVGPLLLLWRRRRRGE